MSYQPPIQDTTKIDDTKLTGSKVAAQSADQPKEKPTVPSPSRGKLEQSINGTARQAELNGQLQSKTESGSAITAAQKILENPKLSNEAKIAELQKTLGNTNKAEFEHFVKKYPNFSKEQQELIHSAFTESEKLMGRVSSELPAAEQLNFVKNAVMRPSVGKTKEEDAKRLERFDKGIASWMENTDLGTLNKALDGRNIDMRASAKLLGVLAFNSNRLIMRMGHDHGKIVGENYGMATDLMHLAMGSYGGQPYTREMVERAAMGKMIENAQNRHERNVLVWED